MSNKNLTVSFLGIGLMGLPMCSNIAKAGFAVKAFNRNLEKLKGGLIEQYSLLMLSHLLWTTLIRWKKIMISP